MNIVELKNTRIGKVCVVGVGGGGRNAMFNMLKDNYTGVNLIMVDTNIKGFGHKNSPIIETQIGKKLTEGLGAGADPKVGREAALENKDEIKDVLKDSKLVFITAGMGGGTGTGAAPVVAEICKEIGAITIAVVSKPFSFEGKKRARQAELGIDKLMQYADTFIAFSNDKLREIAPRDAKMLEMFIEADKILSQSVKGILDLIIHPGHVNIDLADFKTTIKNGNRSIVGMGIADGKNKISQAVQKATTNPLIENISIGNSERILLLSTATLTAVTCTMGSPGSNVQTAGMNIYWHSPANAATSAPPAIKSG